MVIVNLPQVVGDIIGRDQAGREQSSECSVMHIVKKHESIIWNETES